MLMIFFLGFLLVLMCVCVYTTPQCTYRINSSVHEARRLVGRALSLPEQSDRDATDAAVLQARIAQVNAVSQCSRHFGCTLYVQQLIARLECLPTLINSSTYH
jgi:hypothetical protein